MIPSPSCLQYQILKKGKGPSAISGDKILLYETTSYLDGTVLYSNENTGRLVQVLIGGIKIIDIVNMYNLFHINYFILDLKYYLYRLIFFKMMIESVKMVEIAVNGIPFLLI